MIPFASDFAERQTRYCLRDARAGADLQYRRMLTGRALQGFTEGLENKNEVILTKEEVQKKCFQLLGYLEQYQEVPQDDEALKRELSLLTKGEVPERDAQEPRASAAFHRCLMALSSQKETPKPPLELVDVDAPPVIRETPESEKARRKKEYQEKLAERIRGVLAYPQVQKEFERLRSEEQRIYSLAKPKLQKVRHCQQMAKDFTSAMVQTYQEDKKRHQTLTQGAQDLIRKIQQHKTAVQTAEKDIWTDVTLDSGTYGCLLTQELLQYKHQMETRGFAMTPSRRKLFDRIVELALGGRRVFLVGSTGTGKTELAFYALDELTGGYEIIPWHEGPTPRDIFGYRELWTDEKGNPVSGPKPGPFTRAAQTGVGVVQEEYTGGSTRTMLGMKSLMNAKPGEQVKLPGFNGQIFELPMEIFTGNLQDEKTKDRTDLDPAILRMLTGVDVQYMPATEMTQIILAKIIERSGVLKLSIEEIKCIQKLSRAAELMQQFHNREFENLGKLPPEERTLLAAAFGGSATDLSNAKLDKNFLDPGTLFSLFADYDFSAAKGQTFAEHLSRRLEDFLQDPKNKNVPEEKKLALQILKISGAVSVASTIERVQIEIPEAEKAYLLPSEMGILQGRKKISKDPFASGGADGGGKDPPPPPPPPEGGSLENVERIMGKNFFGSKEWAWIYPDYPITETIPPLPADIESILNEDCPFESGKKVFETHVMHLLPKEVGGKPFTINQMRAMEGQQQSSTHTGNVFYKTQKQGDDECWFDKLGSSEVFAQTTPEAMEWVLMPKTTVPNTKTKNYDQQDLEITQYSKYRTAKANELTSGIILHAMLSGKRIYENEYGWCQDSTSAALLVRVGRFGAGGFCVSRGTRGSTLASLGRAVVRNFCIQGKPSEPPFRKGVGGLR